jgi:hypothetical protein
MSGRPDKFDLSQHPYVMPFISDDDGRLVLHWPEGLRSVEISREALQALVDRANGDWQAAG